MKRLGNSHFTTHFPSFTYGQTQSSTAVGLRRSPHTTRTVIRTQRLEAVPQGLHVGVFVALKLEAGRNNLSRPGDARGVVVGFEHKIEVARVGRVDGEVVGAVPRVGLGVGGEPCLCGKMLAYIQSKQKFMFGNTYRAPPWRGSGTSRHRTSHRPSSPWP